MHQAIQGIKRVCIYGTGGVGGYYGGKIAAAFQKEPPGTREVYFIARGAHLEAIQRDGITVKTPDGIIRGKPARATSDFHQVPAPDLVLLCTKSYDLKAAVEAIKTQADENTVVIPLLNGVDIYERVRAVLESGIVLPSCVYLGTHIESPGVISQSGGNGIILSGKDPRFPHYDAARERSFFRELGIGFEWNDDPHPAIWEKYIFIAAFGLVTASAGKTLGEVMEDAELRQMTRDIIREISSIAAKKRAILPGDIVQRTLDKAGNFPFGARTSYQRDVESWPKRNEGDLYGGTILREGLALGVPTPVTEIVYARIMRPR